MIENGFTPTWVGALRLITLDGRLSGRHLTYLYMESKALYNSMIAIKSSFNGNGLLILVQILK